MERGHGHSYLPESDIESSSIEISSEEISENEKTLEHEIHGKERYEKRRTRWEDLFEHVSKYVV